MTTHTIRLHRILRTTPERMYRAFLDADAMCKGFPLMDSRMKFKSR